jgi:hypothetical protein
MKVLHGTWLVALALFARDDTPRYAPQEGTQLARTWESRIELELDELEATVYGYKIDQRALGMEMKLELERHLEVTDTLGALQQGRPERVERSFATAHARTKLRVGAAGREDNLKLEGDSPLVGEKVVFEREGDGWKLGFGADSTGDEALLEGLEQDLDLTALLPDHSVEIGTSWKPEAGALDVLLRPGGSLKLELDASGDKINGAEILRLSPDLLFGSCEGHVKGTLVSVENQSGARLARIRLEIDVRAKQDLAAIARQAFEDANDFRGPTVEMQEVTDELAWKAEGELVWDLAAGHLRSASVDGELEASYHERQIWVTEGKLPEFERSMSFRGTLSVRLEIATP